MGHKPWDLPWRRAEKRSERQQWKCDVAGEDDDAWCTCDTGPVESCWAHGVPES